MDAPLLSVRDLTIGFGGLWAVQELDFEVPDRAIVSLIGPNGAGKTTCLNSISGFVRATGSISYRGRELLSQPPHRRAALGIGRTFQSVQLFTSMTLLQNLLTGQHASLGGNVLLDMARLPILSEERAARKRARQILERLGIERFAHRRAGSLPFGVQKLAGVARALAGNPRLLLLDEPAAGLSRGEAAGLGMLISSLRDELGITILLVEHNMRLVMRISDLVVVLDHGRKLTEGVPQAVSRAPEVISAYLGTTDAFRVMEEVQDELTERP